MGKETETHEFFTNTLNIDSVKTDFPCLIIKRYDTLSYKHYWHTRVFNKDSKAHLSHISSPLSPSLPISAHLSTSLHISPHISILPRSPPSLYLPFTSLLSFSSPPLSSSFSHSLSLSLSLSLHVKSLLEKLH